MTLWHTLLAALIATLTITSTAATLQVSSVYYDPIQAGSDRNIHYPHTNHI